MGQKEMDRAIHFSSKSELLDSLGQEIDLVEFKANFSNSSIEKQYYNAFNQNFHSYNLVQQWMLTFSEN